MANKNKIISQAQKYITKGQWDKAVKELQKLVAEDPNDVRSLLKLGDVYSKKGDRDNATKVYKQVAESYSDQGFFLKAVAVYKQILKHDPKHLQVTMKLAELYEHLGLTSEAMAQYHRASLLQEEQGRQKETLDVLKRMVDLDADNVASRIKLAESFSRENMLPEAISEFEKAAEVLRKQNRIDDYIKVAERLVYHDQTRLDVIKELARLYLERGDAKRGLAKLQICFKAQPRDIEVLRMLSQAFTALGQHQKTIFVYKELARVYQDEGKLMEANEVLQQILHLDPNDPDARQMMGSGPTARSPKPATPSFAVPALSPPPPPPPPAAPAPTPIPILAPSLAPRPPSMAPIPSSDWSVPSQPGYPFGAAAPPTESRTAPAPRPPSLAPRPPPPPVLTTGEVDLRPKAAPAPSRLPPPAGRDASQIAKVLTETDVYIKYGLREKALGHLRRVFEIDPDNIDAYSKMRDIYRSMGDLARAAEAIANMMHVLNRRGEVAQLDGLRGELAKLVPGHPLVSGGIPGSLPAPTPPAEMSDEISVDIEDADAEDQPDVFELVDEIGSEPALKIPPLMPPPLDDEPFPVDAGGGLELKSDDLMDESHEYVFGASTERGGRPLVDDLDAPAVLPDEDLPEANSGLIMLSEVETGADADDEGRPSFAEEVDEDSVVDEEEVAEERAPAASWSARGKGHPSKDIAPPRRPPDEVDPFAGNERSEITARNSLDEARREVTDRSDVFDMFARQPTAIRRDVTQRQDVPSDVLKTPLIPLDLEDPEDTDEKDQPDLLSDIVSAAEKALSADDGSANDELDEAEFLIEAGLAEEAREAVGSVLERFPDHARALEMMGRVEALEQEAALQGELSDSGEEEEDEDEEEDQEKTGPVGEPTLPLDHLPLPAEDGTSPEDRYDQGMLFKEIGRLEDAIREFRGAARHTSRYLQSLEMIGHCLMEKGTPKDAIAYFARTLEGGADGISATNLKYEIGNACEMAGDPEGAAEWFTACHRDDPDHRDVKERLDRLGGPPPSGGGNGAKKGNGVHDNPRASSSKKSKITYL